MFSYWVVFDCEGKESAFKLKEMFYGRFIMAHIEPEKAIDKLPLGNAYCVLRTKKIYDNIELT
jgi:hypothetical protein